MLTALQAPIEALDKSEQNFVASVHEHGWFRTDVFEEDGHPGFSYSTGFWVNCGQPEVIMHGMKTVAHDIFWDLFRQAKSGNPLPLGLRSNEIFGNAAAYIFPVSSKFYPDHLGWSRWFYAGDDFPCVQVIWPDREGIFPWEDGFDQAFNGKQVDLTEKGWSTSILD